MEINPNHSKAAKPAAKNDATNKANCKSAEEHPTNTCKKWQWPDVKTKMGHPSSVAGAVGFVLFTCLFMWLWWLIDLLERVHINGWFIICGAASLFFLAIGALALLLIELLNRKKAIIGASLAVCFAFICFLFLYRREFFEKVELPSITIVSLRQVDAKNPLGTIIVFKSKTLISNVWAKAYWENPNDPAYTWGLLTTNVADALPPEVPANLDFLDIRRTNVVLFAENAFVNVEVRFKTKDFPQETNQVFQFFVRHSPNGEYDWIENGIGKSVADIMKGKHGLPFPFLNICVTSIEDNSKVDKNHPVKIGYSWQNWGGAAAKNVYIEWGVTDGRTLFWWANYWNNEVFNQVLAPNDFNSTYSIYADSVHPFIYDGILSGKLTLVGTALFKDTLTRDYEMDMKVVRTNEAFEVRILRLGGYFKTIDEKYHIPPRPGMLE